MKFTKKRMVFAVLAVMLLGAGIFGVSVHFNKAAEEEKALTEKAEASGTTTHEFVNQTREVEGVAEDVQVDRNSSDSAILDVMHKMSHQKVRADQKWGAVPMTPANIQTVLESAGEKAWSNQQMKRQIIAILEAWRNGDFTHADRDHNVIWNYQGGTIGEAFGVMSETEETEFIRNNFK